MYNGIIAEASLAALPGPKSAKVEASFAAALATGALWHPKRMRGVGYVVNGACQLCGCDNDNLYHIIWMCPASADIRAQHQNQAALMALRAGELSPDPKTRRVAHVAGTRGIIPDLMPELGTATPEQQLVRGPQGLQE